MSITGIESMLKNIDKLQGNGDKYGREAVKEGAEVYAKVLSKNTANDMGDLSQSVETSGIKGAGKGSLEVDVGYDSQTGWRAHFPNDGTVYQKPQHFKERSTEEAREPIQKIFLDKLKGVTDL